MGPGLYAGQSTEGHHFRYRRRYRGDRHCDRLQQRHKRDLDFLHLGQSALHAEVPRLHAISSLHALATSIQSARPDLDHSRADRNRADPAAARSALRF